MNPTPDRRTFLLGTAAIATGARAAFARDGGEAVDGLPALAPTERFVLAKAGQLDAAGITYTDAEFYAANWDIGLDDALTALLSLHRRGYLSAVEHHDVEGTRFTFDMTTRGRRRARIEAGGRA